MRHRSESLWHSRHASALHAVLLLLMFTTLSVTATDIVWTNTAGGNWSAPANWEPNLVPGALDNVHITNSGTYTVLVNSTQTVNSVTAGAASGTQTLALIVGTFTINSPSQLGSNCNLTVSGGTLTGPGDLVMDGLFTWGGGTISGIGAFNANGGMNWNGGIIKTLSARHINNAGTAIWTAGLLQAGNGAVVSNLVGATFDITFDSDTTATGGTSPVFANAGTFRKTGGSGTAFLDAFIFKNSGSVEIQTGTLSVGNDFYPLDSSTFTFWISALTNFGSLEVEKLFRMAGTLNVVVTNGYVPDAGNRFAIITWAKRSGAFSAASGLDLGGGLYFQGVALPDALLLITKTTVVPVPPPPTNLVNQVVAFGDTAVFSFTPLGIKPLRYQWTFEGTNMMGQTNAQLIIPNVIPSKLGTYCAEVVDAFNVSNTYCAQLLGISPPGISTQPTGTITNSGANLTLTVTGSGDGPLRYQWRINGENVPYATNSTYTITNAQPRNGGIYSVLVANPVRVILSDNAKVRLNTNSLPFDDSLASAGTLTNTYTGVGSGNNTNATDEAGEPDHGGKSGTHSVWLNWTAPANGVATFDTRGSDFDTLMSVYGVTNGPLNVTNLTSLAGDDDQGRYFSSEAAFTVEAGTNYYIAVDGLASASGDIVLTWSLDTNITEIPRIIQQPVDTVASLGGSAGFSVFAASTTNLGYQWILGGWLAFAGKTNATLNLTNVGPTDVGAYSVEVSSVTGQRVISLPANLEIGPAPDAKSFDKLEELLASVASGGFFSASMLASSDADQTNKRGHGKGRGRGHGGIIGPQTAAFPSVSAGTTGSQEINNFNSTTESGEPIHSDDVIGGSSRWYLLTALTNGTMVVDTLGSDIDTVLAVYTGTNILTLSLVAEDDNGASDGVRSEVKFETEPETDYLIAVDGVDGEEGNITVNWRFGTPPNTTGPAEELLVELGDPLTLDAGITNDPTSPYYQWQLNGVNIEGATNETYSLSAMSYDAVGSYTVIVSNLVGEVINAIATVTADAPLQLALEGSGATITGSATQAVVLNMSTNLTEWIPIYTNTTPLVPIIYNDDSATNHSQGYYRLLQWP